MYTFTSFKTTKSNLNPGKNCLCSCGFRELSLNHILCIYTDLAVGEDDFSDLFLPTIASHFRLNTCELSVDEFAAEVPNSLSESD